MSVLRSLPVLIALITVTCPACTCHDVSSIEHAYPICLQVARSSGHLPVCGCWSLCAQISCRFNLQHAIVSSKAG